jgi:ATP/ADP translocase
MTQIEHYRQKCQAITWNIIYFEIREYLFLKLYFFCHSLINPILAAVTAIFLYTHTHTHTE